MSKPNGPCLNCEDRDITCHAHCIAYKLFRAELDAENERKRVRQEQERAGMTPFYQQSIWRKKGER